jgi:long-chain acyl-CoA synthetase
MAKNFRSWPEHWPRTLSYPKIPVYGFLDQTARRVPNRIAIIFGGLELTYNELKQLSDRFAAALVAMGVRKGDCVSIHLPNCPQFAIAYYGALKIGAVFSPMSPLLAPREVAHQLSDCGAETLVSLDLLYPGISSALPDTPVKRVITTSIADCYSAIVTPLKPLGKSEVPGAMDMVSLLARHDPHSEEAAIDVEQDLAHLAYTGGTTGVSKGVMLTHANVVANVVQYGNWRVGAQVEMIDGVLTAVYPPGADEAELSSGQDRDTGLVVVPWFHAMGTVGYLNCLVYGGVTMVVFPRFEPREYIEAVGKYNASSLGGAPQLYIPLINLPDFDSYDLSGVKVASSGAAPLPAAVMEKLMKAFPEGYVSEGYGLTECTMGATSNPPSREGVRPGSVGLPVFDTELKVVDLTTGEDLPPGSEGESCIRGPQVMRGYYKNPEATAEVLRGGWLYTGDIGREDEDGYFYITDRKKDMILYKGYNVYPREIEEVLFQHPAVLQCAVVGKPDIEAGELPVAFVELMQGEETMREEILQHVNSQVAHYKKLRDVVFVETIPVSGAGKVLKKELRGLLTQQEDS